MSEERGLDRRGLFCLFWNKQTGKGSKKGSTTMILQGLVLSGDVMESTFYDQSTGQPKPGHSIKLTVLDTETDEKYDCQITDGFATLEHLKELKKQGQPLDVLQQVAAQLRTELPPKMTPITLEVRRVKGKAGFMTVVCRLAVAA
jgi:hypothetical protein